jgi:hypothetical protein
LAQNYETPNIHKGLLSYEYHLEIMGRNLNLLHFINASPGSYMRCL